VLSAIFVECFALFGDQPLQLCYVISYVFILFQTELLNAMNVNPELLSSGTHSDKEVITGGHL